MKLPKTEREKRAAYPIHTSYERYARKDEGAKRVVGHCPSLEDYDRVLPQVRNWIRNTDRRNID